MSEECHKIKAYIIQDKTPKKSPISKASEECHKTKTNTMQVKKTTKQKPIWYQWRMPKKQKPWQASEEYYETKTGGGTCLLILMSHDPACPLEWSPKLSIFQNKRDFKISCTQSKVIWHNAFQNQSKMCDKKSRIIFLNLRHFVHGNLIPAAAALLLTAD